LLETRLTPANFSVSSLADSGAGTLRQAILDSNGSAGPNTIDFSVAGIIQLTSGALPAITDPVTIDGTSAPGFASAPVVEIDANAFAGLAFNTGSANSSLVSLSIVNAAGNGVTLDDSGIVVAGNYLGLGLDGSTTHGNSGIGLAIESASSNDTIGGTAAVDRNVISGNSSIGISVNGASGVQIVGNFIGTDATGTLARGNGGSGIVLTTGASSNTIGGTAAQDRNIISGNTGNGIDIETDATGIIVVNNRIGTDVTGAVALGNTQFGIAVGGGAHGNVIGGSNAADQNLISGNQGGGIELGASEESQASDSAEVIGNLIGTDNTGQNALPNRGNGIMILSSSNIIGTGNVIAFNTQSGVEVSGGAENSILSNSIFSNSANGIDLESGGNLDQPSPQLGYAVESPGSITGSFTVQVGGVLDAQPDTVYQIQIFASLASTPAGQGQILLGSVSVTTNSTGFANFTLRNASVPAGGGTTFTATDTSPANNTSAFSTAIRESTANQAYVANVYQLLLSRIPDPGSGIWVNDLNNGVAPSGVVLGIEGSTEYLNDQVFALYNRYLSRKPDSSGAQFWTNFLLTGGTLEQVAEGLTSSGEYFVDQGGTNQGYVTGLYHDVLNRNPSNAELAGWEAVLDVGASRLSVAVDFLTSQEYRTDLVESDYTIYLERSADSGGLMIWVNALNTGATDQEVLAGIFGSPEGYDLWS
jgi:hypothetical protein